jgi:hypothetical protein
MKKTLPLSPASVLVAAPQHVSSRLGDGVVMLGLETGFYYSLNSSCVRIRELLQTPRSLAELVAELEQVYSVDPDRLRRDIVPVIEAMVSQGVLTLANSE